MVDGKWRVGLLALRDLVVGEEILMEYGDQPNPPAFMRRRKITDTQVRRTVLVR
jgi:hypothetical protein